MLYCQVAISGVPFLQFIMPSRGTVRKTTWHCLHYENIELFLGIPQFIIQVKKHIFYHWASLVMTYIYNVIEKMQEVKTHSYHINTIGRVWHITKFNTHRNINECSQYTWIVSTLTSHWMYMLWPIAYAAAVAGDMFLWNISRERWLIRVVESSPSETALRTDDARYQRGAVTRKAWLPYDITWLYGRFQEPDRSPENIRPCRENGGLALALLRQPFLAVPVYGRSSVVEP